MANRNKEALEKAKDEKRHGEFQVNSYKMQLAQNCYSLKFFEKQIKSGDIIIKDEHLLQPVPMERVLQTAYQVRAAIEAAIFNLKNLGLTDEDIVKEVEMHKKDKYDYLMIE